MVNVGELAPDFVLPSIGSHGPIDLHLEALRGRKVVLLFVPFLHAPACTDELLRLRSALAGFRERGAEVIALSVDSPFAQRHWADAHCYAVRLASDFNREVSKAYGAQHEELMGLRGVAKRAAFVIDEAGVLRYAWVAGSPEQKPDLEEIEACLRPLG